MSSLIKDLDMYSTKEGARFDYINNTNKLGKLLNLLVHINVWF